MHAGKLQGKLLLVVGELDTNVDPSSTMQVVNALIKANKYFDLLVMPGEDHPAGRRGAERAVRRQEAVGLLRPQPAGFIHAGLESDAGDQIDDDAGGESLRRNVGAAAGALGRRAGAVDPADPWTIS